MIDINALIEHGPRGFESKPYLENLINRFQELLTKLRGKIRPIPGTENDLHNLDALSAALLEEFKDINPQSADLELHIVNASQLLEKYRSALIKFNTRLQSDLKNYPLAMLTQPFTDYIQRLNESEIPHQFLVQPEGLNGLAWLIHHKNQQSHTPEVSDLLANLWMLLQNYQEGKTEPLKQMSDLLAIFQERYPEQVQPWMVGIQRECQIMQKRSEAILIQEKLDKINIKLQSKLNTAELQYIRQHPDYHKLKKEFETAKKPGWLQLFNIPRYFRKSRYNQQKREIELIKANAEREHQAKYGEKIKKHQSKFTALKNDVVHAKNSPVKGIVMPRSFANHQATKQLALKNHGMTLGGLAQNKIISLGSSGGLCHGFTKEWIFLMNANRDLKHDYQLIDKLNLYSKKSENQFDHLVNDINHLTVTDETFKQFLSQIEESKNKVEFTERHYSDPKFSEELFKRLDETMPPSIILSIGKGDNRHALGIVETKHGIWFNDSNSGCFYFPADPTKESARSHFYQFYKDYMASDYPNFSTDSYLTISHKYEDNAIGVESSAKKVSPTYDLKSEKNTSSEITENQTFIPREQFIKNKMFISKEDDKDQISKSENPATKSPFKKR